MHAFSSPPLHQLRHYNIVLSHLCQVILLFLLTKYDLKYIIMTRR
nr:MAG TPA: hypothetical protein [Caudoviricetes sp.]